MSLLRRNSSELQLLTSKDGCVLLDIEHDQILKLNHVAAEMWQLLGSGQTESQIAISLSAKYQVTEQRIARDLCALMQRIEELGADKDSLFTTPPEQRRQNPSQPSFPWYGQALTESAKKPNVRLVVSALIGLLIFDILLSLFSLKSLCSLVKAWPVKANNSANKCSIKRVCGAVSAACVWYPKRALCLQRSAVTACLLRSKGIAAQMMIGVRPVPFLAHSWVEADGSVINDWPRVKRFYSSLVSH